MVDIHSKETSMYQSDAEIDQNNHDLRVFLTNKIQEIKDKVTANEQVLDLTTFSVPVTSKFKVSKLNDIQAIKSMGTSQKLEENFNNRVLKQNVDYSYKNALLS